MVSTLVSKSGFKRAKKHLAGLDIGGFVKFKTINRSRILSNIRWNPKTTASAQLYWAFLFFMKSNDSMHVKNNFIYRGELIEQKVENRQALKFYLVPRREDRYSLSRYRAMFYQIP